MNTTPDYETLIKERRAKEAADRAETRKDILSRLKTAGIATIEICYNGYGDEGNVDEITALPDNDLLDKKLHIDLEHFGWELAYSTNPGFENNEGGRGEITWNAATDTINITHHSCFIDYDTFEHEDV